MMDMSSVKCLLLFCIVITFVELQAVTSEHCKVLILGAGMSGITAAKTLHENGEENFIILEGAQNIGGRIKKAEFAGTIIELGANWVQGTENNPIWDLAQKYGLNGSNTVPYPEPGFYLVRDENGHNVTNLDNLAGMQRASDKLNELVTERQRLGGEDLDALTGLRLVGWQAKNPAQSMVEYLYLDFDAAVRPQYISMGIKHLTNGSIDSQGGTQYFVFDKRGYAYIVEEMANSFLDPEDHRLYLNQIVDQIIWGDNFVTVSTKTGELYSADYLLVTFSIGVLKSNAVDFVPDLPPQVLEPIYKIEMANYIKIFLKFPTTFWDRQQYILYASENRGYYPVWQDLETDAGLSDTGMNILVVTVTGEEANRVQYQSSEQTQAEIMVILRNVYGKNIPDPISFYYPRWQHDELFYGCYSNTPIGMSHKDFLALESNVSRIYFAGEATHELYNGYVHGAYYSGLERAEKILNDIKANRDY